MKKALKYILVALIYFLIGWTASAQNNEILHMADSAYNARNYRTALSLYNKVLDTNGASSSLYYNIGNTHYRIGNVGQAIVAYERALRLDPSHEDARANLEFVNSRLKGLPQDNSSFLTNIHNDVVAQASANTWSCIALVLFLLVLGFVSLYFFGSGAVWRKTGFFGGIIMMVLFVYAFVIAWETAAAVNRHDVAVVITQNAHLTSNPGTSKNKDEKTVSIPEGSKVEIIDSLATPTDPVAPMWYNVALNSNTHAWIASTDVEQI